MTTPIAAIGTIAPLVPFSAVPDGIATTGSSSGAGAIAGTLAGGLNSAFASALNSALGGTSGAMPLSSLVSTGALNPTAIAGAAATPGAAGLMAALPGSIAPGSVAPGSVAPGSVAPGAPASAITSNAGAPVTDSAGFDLGASVGRGFDAVQAAQHDANTLAVQAATGVLVDPAQLTIASTKAQLMTQVATAIQSKAVTAFNTIMSMQA